MKKQEITQNQCQYDEEWIQLISLAKFYGFTTNEVRFFIKCIKEKDY
ncbi:MAG: hypothetical protein ACQEWU_07970 [Bacillota bacterium]|uniref:Sin domain-containing protein n=1 Tax=Virgibacillus salarius TaxID=447199 RepID=A0A941ICW7_9BACI|nr:MULTISPECIES: hypothetical protein [Bacillaceae]NAZ10650.1 hypothetical protein [Agaribacter marinus]MBR7797941.1 hypothetical protein [Virgibacillus salarius]MCC2250014.1 anti-repressor SinI family protein [Virgibacillus sp. AGTR]MDY7044648.1 hypothetical protein [Virgibacillus sp. M23]QRZ18132.1 hypothetical protein JUJ52_20895 [Virgibacillus sp. AGTR]